MSALQSDLFGVPAPVSQHRPDRPGDEVVALVRARLHATLALVQAAEAMPWTGMLAIIREDNAFRYGKDALPPEEGAALWQAFDREMDRLYRIMNQGCDGIDPA